MPFMECCRLIGEAQAMNQEMVYMLENVKIDPALEDEDETQNGILQWHTGDNIEFKEINASELGAPQSRPRRIASNVMDMDDARRKKPIDPVVLLEALGHRLVNTGRGLAPCVMANGRNTHAPVKTIELESGHRGFAPTKTLERLQGYPEGLTIVFGRVAADEGERTKPMGNAFHSVFVEGVFSNWRSTDMRAADSQRKATNIGSTRVSQGPEPTMLEGKLHTMTDEELSRWMDKQLEGYVQPRLEVKAKSEETSPHQVPNRSRYQTPNQQY